MLRAAFEAMGTRVEMLLDARPGVAAERALADGRLLFGLLERSLSRFDPNSELSQLNRDGEIVGSPDFVRVVELALAARETTQGLFDPTVHDALVAAGYDRTFDELPAARTSTVTGRTECGGNVEIDGDRILLTPGVRLDLGGIAKGYAVDRCCALVAEAGPTLVNAGGDLAVCGGAWPVGVPDGPTLELSRGAIATSGRDRRRWRVGDETRHHLIDPGTGKPAETDLLRVTVVGRSAVEAEVLAKAAFLGADVDAPRVLAFADGRRVLAGGLG